MTVGGQWWRLFSSPFVNAGVIQVSDADWPPGMRPGSMPPLSR